MARIAVKTDAQRAGEAVSAYNRLLEEQLAATDSNLNP
jgi:hypothetical protein